MPRACVLHPGSGSLAASPEALQLQRLSTSPPAAVGGLSPAGGVPGASRDDPSGILAMASATDQLALIRVNSSSSGAADGALSRPVDEAARKSPRLTGYSWASKKSMTDAGRTEVLRLPAHTSPEASPPAGHAASHLTTSCTALNKQMLNRCKTAPCLRTEAVV